MSPLRLEVRPFLPFAPGEAVHFYLLQFVGFGYLLYRLLSRDYGVYGLLPSELFDYEREFVLELWPIPGLHVTSLQFIYHVVPRPTPDVIVGLQLAAAAACVLGLLGLAPRLAAGVAFAITLHLTGMVQSSNAEIDGGTLALCAVLVLALSPQDSFFRVGRSNPPSARHSRYRWPVFLFVLMASSYYTVSGLNKIVDVGPHWPFVLHLERLAHRHLANSLFLSSRHVDAEVVALHQSYALSCVAGVVTLVGEALFVTVLFLPRHRLFHVGSMIALHVVVALVAGINFLGNGALLLLCLDWGVLVRPITVRVNESGARRAQHLRSLVWLGRIEWVDASGGDHAVEVVENGDRRVGWDALEQILVRSPLLWPLLLPSRVPFFVPVVRSLGRSRARARRFVEGP